MANVSPFTRLRQNQDGRAQLLIVAGVMIAVTLVVLAILLNSVIYAENLGSRGSDIGGSDAASYEESLSTAADELMLTINQNTDSQDSHSDIQDEFGNEMFSWYRMANKYQVRNGDYTDIEVKDTTNGAQVRQTHIGVFENAKSKSTWTVVEDANIRNYVIKIDEVYGGVSNPFYLTVSNGEEWNLKIYDDGGETKLVAETDGDTVECSTSEDEVVIDFSTATLNGEDCEAAVFADGLEAPYTTVEYENGNQIAGEYQMTVDEPALEDSDKFYEPSKSQSPYVVSGLYSADISLVYENSQIVYKSIITTEPNEI